MAELHGTRELIGGGERAPRPETAAQTHGQVCERWQCVDFAMANLHGACAASGDCGANPWAAPTV